MNKNLKRVLAVAIASGLALGTVGTTQASAKKKVRTVTLAFQGPLTGPDAQLGQDQLPGALFALAEYNAKNPKRQV
ncbi:MAG: branched chain amino acid ABC transporter substrate-binding protein, partial [Actinomycetes bacterium]